MIGGEARLNLAGSTAAARLIANGEQDGEAVGARCLQQLVIGARLRGDTQVILPIGEAVGHLHDLFRVRAAGEVLHLHRLGVCLVFREVDAHRRVAALHENIRPTDDDVLARRDLAVHALGAHVGHLVDDRAGGRQVQVEGDLLQRLQQCLAGGEGNAHTMFLRVEAGRLALERAGEVEQPLPNAVHEALAIRDGLHLLLVGQREDVLNGFLAVLGALRHDVGGDVRVVIRAGNDRLGGVIARLGGQYVVVQVRI